MFFFFIFSTRFWDLKPALLAKRRKSIRSKRIPISLTADEVFTNAYTLTTPISLSFLSSPSSSSSSSPLSFFFFFLIRFEIIEITLQEQRKKKGQKKKRGKKKYCERNLAQWIDRKLGDFQNVIGSSNLCRDPGVRSNGEEEETE